MRDSIDRDDLRTTIETLAAIERGSASDGEHEAAAWIADRLRAEGCAVEVDEERAYRGYARSLAGQSAVSALGGVVALRARRPASRAAGGLLAVLAGAGIVEDVSNGPQLFRRLTMRRRVTHNVVATAGDPAADRTLVILAHHDAASSGAVFDQTVHRAFARRFPGVVERIDTAIPIWWPVLAGPLLVAAGAVRGRRGMTTAGTALSLTATAAFADIERSPTVPGANDNLTGVAGLVALARAARERPLHGVRLLLVSAGAEESLQGGIRAFARRRFPQLDPARTWVVNLDTVGAPHLVLLEGEGPFVMEDYADPAWRDRVAACAGRLGVPLRRGMRARTSTDSVIPSRAGYPTATLVSVDETKAIPHYHLPTDTPEHLHLGTVADAVAVCEAVARDLVPA